MARYSCPMTWPGQCTAYGIAVRERDSGHKKVIRMDGVGFWLACTLWPAYEIIEHNALMESVMAGILHVRNLDGELIAALKRRASRHGRSTEAEHAELLRQALAADADPDFDKPSA